MNPVPPASSDAAVRLRALLLTEARVDARIHAHLTTKLGLESVADLASLWTEEEQVSGVQEVLQEAGLESDRLQRSRLRTALQLARAELQSTVTKRSSIDAIDLDRPLEPEVQKQQEDRFYSLYRLKLTPEVAPSDALFGRIYRELRRNTVSVIDLTKVRSAAEQAAHAPLAKRLKLSDSIALLTDDAGDIPASGPMNLLALLRKHRTLCLCFSLAGTTLKDSKLTPGTQTVDADLSELLAYHEYVTNAAIIQTMSASAAQAWIIDRDRQTRLKARTLYLENWPLAEALREAREKSLAVIWTIQSTPATTAAASTPAASAPHSASANSSAQPVTLCPMFNTDAGCTLRQKHCPHKGLHRCANCSSWQHAARDCPRARNPAAATSRQQRKGAPSHFTGKSQGGKGKRSFQ
jgi:hypothetical protein